MRRRFDVGLVEVFADGEEGNIAEGDVVITSYSIHYTKLYEACIIGFN